MRAIEKMLSDSKLANGDYVPPSIEGQVVASECRLVRDIPGLLAALATLRTAVTYFLTEDWSHITDVETLREIAEDVARKDRRKWGSLKAELAAKDADIEALETVLSAGQMLLCEKDADIEALRATVAHFREWCG